MYNPSFVFPHAAIPPKQKRIKLQIADKIADISKIPLSVSFFI